MKLWGSVIKAMRSFFLCCAFAATFISQALFAEKLSPRDILERLISNPEKAPQIVDHVNRDVDLQVRLTTYLDKHGETVILGLNALGLQTIIKLAPDARIFEFNLDRNEFTIRDFVEADMFDAVRDTLVKARATRLVEIIEQIHMLEDSEKVATTQPRWKKFINWCNRKVMALGVFLQIPVAGISASVLAHGLFPGSDIPGIMASASLTVATGTIALMALGQALPFLRYLRRDGLEKVLFRKILQYADAHHIYIGSYELERIGKLRERAGIMLTPAIKPEADMLYAAAHDNGFDMRQKNESRLCSKNSL